ncbi:MAG: hypothetical protein Q3M24_02730 [Candidatus Electrothrix aestuarii]|uniref:Uncharacterized protein n=1 Tax=Candidatus Electrothrix aestuarii TaxID=3062594 RepID=A0AAU8LWS6_9BACT|nr:hypothetical protein [Candidatus Electrothrix aestuarii]
MQTKKLSEYRNPAEDYDNMLENLYILQDETTVKSLLQTRLNIAQGMFQGSEVKDAFKDLMDS